MNLLFLCNEYPPGRHGGIGTAVQLLARALVRQGHRVVVAGLYQWGYGEKDREDDNGVLVYRFRPRLDTPLVRNPTSFVSRATVKLLTTTGAFTWDVSSSLARYGVFLERLVAQHRIDLIELSDYQSYMAYCLRKVDFPVLAAPYVVKLHGSITYFACEAGETVAPQIKEMEEELLRGAQAVASVSKYAAHRTAECLSYRSPIRVLYNGIDPIPPKVVVKKPGTVIFTGTLIPKKGIYQLIAAWNKVNREMPEARLSVYGKGDVEKIAALMDLTARESVQFCGHVDRGTLMEELATANLAVFPSYAECFSLAPMEAMAVGTTVIYSLRTSGPELITHDETGYLCDPDDVDGLANQILELLHDEARCARLATAAQRHVRERFAVDHLADAHIQWYTEVLQSVERVVPPVNAEVPCLALQI